MTTRVHTFRPRARARGVHTWPKKVYGFTLDDLATAPAEPLRLLRALFLDPGRLKPETTRQELTEEAAWAFANVAIALRGGGHEPQPVAHFLVTQKAQKSDHRADGRGSRRSGRRGA
jgi:hypothetical protein